jgi:hypothetical protein
MIREIGETAVAMWWRFFDWLAQVEWRKLIIIWVLLLLLGLTPFGLSKQAVAFIMLSLGLKVLAGGKRKAELEARMPTIRPTKKAWNGAWSKRAWPPCRHRSSRTSCSIPWP